MMLLLSIVVVLFVAIVLDVGGISGSVVVDAFSASSVVVAPCGFFVPSFSPSRHSKHQQPRRTTKRLFGDSSNDDELPLVKEKKKKKSVVIVGAGWGGLSAAHALSRQGDVPLDITVIEASPRVGGLVRDGYRAKKKHRSAEAGQHGFWDSYDNIYKLLETEIDAITDIDDILTGYAEQGQYSPNGLEAVWPVYRHQVPQLPTGLAQGVYTKFLNLPVRDRLSAAPLVLAFSELFSSSSSDDDEENDDLDNDLWSKYDSISFRDLCVKLGVSQRCYDEAFEPMILTGLFAPGAECSAAAALGMAYFFVLQSQNSFDVRWCKGNIGDKIFTPWIEQMMTTTNNTTTDGRRQTVNFRLSTRVIGFEQDNNKSTRNDDDSGRSDDEITRVICQKVVSEDEGSTTETETFEIDCDALVFAVGGPALNRFVTGSPNTLARYGEFRKFANLRGTGVLATRLYLDRMVPTKYSANACWGFDDNVGMTFFDITKLHGLEIVDDDNYNEEKDVDVDAVRGSVLEVDYYHAASLLAMNDDDIVRKVKNDLDVILGDECRDAQVVDAAVVKLPQAVNWYSPGSYKNMPELRSESVPNCYFAGDIVRSDHGSWSQEKAYVTGKQVANLILNKNVNDGIIPLDDRDEFHVRLGRKGVSTIRNIARDVLEKTLMITPTESNNNGKSKIRLPSLVDFLW